MANKIKVVSGDTYRNVYAVGDLHGEITKLEEALKEEGFDKTKDLLISVGDLIDRGEDSLACLELINEPWFVCVMGNHEKMAFDAVSTGKEELFGHWFMNGGSWFSGVDKIYAESLIMKAGELPLIIEYSDKDKKIVICHADYPLDVYKGVDFANYEMHILWSRERINRAKKEGSTSEIHGADLFIFGHTPVKEPLHIANQVYIDTGACFGKELTLAKLK